MIHNMEIKIGLICSWVTSLLTINTSVYPAIFSSLASLLVIIKTLRDWKKK